MAPSDTKTAAEQEPSTSSNSSAAAAPDEIWWKNDLGTRATHSLADPRWRSQFECLADDELMEHLLRVIIIQRAKAWNYHKYPCVGQWMFLLPHLHTLTGYDASLRRALSPGSPFSASNPFQVLDLGCCFGQDLRRLAADGLDPRSSNGAVQFAAVDLHRELWDLGFELFRDEKSFRAEFRQIDWLKPDDAAQDWIERRLTGKTDLIFICQFLHLFNREVQMLAVRKLIALSRPGTVILGYQIGSTKPEETPLSWGDMYFHNDKTFPEMWAQCAQDTKTTWTVECGLMSLTEFGSDEHDCDWMGPEKRLVQFSCTRTGNAGGDSARL